MSKRTIGPREAALRALERFRRSGDWSSFALEQECGKAGLDQRDTALAGRLCYSVLQNSALCDFYIDCYSTVKSSKMEPKLLDILRLSVCQLLFFDRVPAFSAVSEGVRLCRENGLARASGLCNAVLRRVSENLASLPEIPGRGTAEHLAVRYSHPLWLAERITKERGYDACMALFNANNAQELPVTAQVNTLKTTTDDLLKRLADDGVEAEMHAWMPDCLYLWHTGRVDSLSAFQDGLFYVQDNASRLAVIASGAEPGMEVLDCCAAPGGKSFAAAIQMCNDGHIVSCDIGEKKLPRITQGARRLGLDILSVLPGDAKNPREDFTDRFDLVLADVPCSGFGVIRKKPEIRYKSQAEIAGLPSIQLEILRAVSRCVKPGGTLLYSTCTILAEENQEVVRAFLNDNPNFEPQNYKLPRPLERPIDGMLTLYPYVYDCDGFFLCRLRRVR